MQLQSPGRACLSLVAGLALLWPLAGRAAAQNNQVNKEEVKFNTFDGVELHGTFYPGNGGAKSPCVLLVSKIGGNRQQAGWEDLALTLQKNDYSVLSFDFRGCNDSQTVDPNLFWRVPANLRFIKGANPRKMDISYKEFSPGYYPMLVNDLAAAKAYLDQRNNARDCNSGELSVVGAEDGAAVTILWMFSEWNRRRFTRDAFNRLVPGTTLEGEDLNSGFWLSAPSSLAGVPLGGFLNRPISEKVPMVFAYSKDDTKAATAAHYLDAFFKGKRLAKLSPELPLGVQGSGSDLLGKTDPAKNEDTNAMIYHYLDHIRKDRTTNAWVQREAVPLYPIPLANYGFPNLR